MPDARAGFDRRIWVGAFACAVSALILYVCCLSPTVTVTGDSGELISASWKLGVAHPSGYPLWSLMGRVFAQIFCVGEIAWRYSLFSSLCGAATIGVVVFIVTRLVSPREYSHRGAWAACGAALLLAGFYFFGSQCVIAEVYALNALVLAAIFFAVISFRADENFIWLFALAALFGLAFNSHLSSIFVWPGILIYLAPTLKRVLNARRVLALCAACALGFSLTLSLPLRARNVPEPQTEIIGGKEYPWFAPLDWGHPNTFARWKKHVTVGQYDSLLWKPLSVKIGGRKLRLLQPTQTPLQAASKFGGWCGFVAISFWWCTPLLILGAVAAFARDENNEASTRARGKRLGAMLLLTFALNIGVAMFYNVDNVFDVANFLFPAYLVLAIWMGLGLETVLRAASKNARVLALCHVAVIGAIVLQWMVFAQSASFRGNTAIRDLALERAASAQALEVKFHRAPILFLQNDDTLFPFWYVQKVLGRAPEAKTVWGPALHAYVKSGRFLELVARAQKQGPVAFAQWDEKIDRRFPFVPLSENGSLWQAANRALPLPARVLAPVQRNVTLAIGKIMRSKVHRVETCGFQIAFALRQFASQKPLAIDAKNGARQIGFIEVLSAPQGEVRGPPPDVETSLPVWKQTRRLIIPQTARPGQVLQTLIPLQFPTELAPGDYDLWTRVVRSPHDASTRWTGAGSVRIVVK